MAKVPYRTREDAGSAEQALYDRLEAERPVPTPNIFLALAHAPKQLDAFLDYANSLRSCDLDKRSRELLILAIAHAVDCTYEIAHHEPYAIGAGLTEQQVKAIPHAETSDLFSHQDLTLIRVGRGFVTGTVSQDDWESLAAQLSIAQLVQVAMTASWYVSGALMMRVLDIDPEKQYPNH